MIRIDFKGTFESKLTREEFIELFNKFLSENESNFVGQVVFAPVIEYAEFVEIKDD